MSAPGPGETFPRGALLAAAALVVFSLVAATAGSLTRQQTGLVSPESPPIVQRRLQFEDTARGSVRVIDVTTAQMVAELEPGTNGFLRGLMRALVRTRKLNGVEDHRPFLLAYANDGSLVLEDPVTSSRIALAAFGPTNAAAFAALLPPPSAQGDQS